MGAIPVLSMSARSPHIQGSDAEPCRTLELYVGALGRHYGAVGAASGHATVGRRVTVEVRSFESNDESPVDSPCGLVGCRTLERKSLRTDRKPPRRDALRRGGLMVENCTYGESYDQCAEST